jgi:hypothetical protein
VFKDRMFTRLAISITNNNVSPLEFAQTSFGACRCMLIVKIVISILLSHEEMGVFEGNRESALPRINAGN